MRDERSKKVVIINDIDSENIEKAILILKNGGAAETHSAYHIVTEAQEIICAYRRTVEKAQKGICRKERRTRRAAQTSAARRTLRVCVAATGFCAAAYGILQLMQFLLEKF